MGTDWPIVRVKDVCSLIVDCVNKTAPVSFHPTKFRMIRTTNVRNGKIDLSDCKYVDEETYKKWTRRARLEAGDVILTREAPIGEVGQIPEQDGLFLGQRLMQYRADPEKLDGRFLLYSFLSPQLQHQFGSHEGSGSVVSHIRVGDCFKFEMRLPSLAVQKRIGEILGSLDDKIDLNRRINQTLEAMAQAVFKSWFVDFDPVKAKIAAIEQDQDPLRAAMRAISGKTDAELDQMPRDQYNQLAATAALFPDAVEELELGEIPKGWEISTIGEMVEIAGGATPDTKNESYWNPPEYFWTSPKDLSGAQSPVFLTTERKISTAGLSRIGSGLLPKGTLLMSSRAPIGYLAITQIPVAINQGYIAMLPGGKLPPLYLLMWCQQNMEEIKGQANGSTFMEISKKAFRPMLVINPGSVVLDRFIETVAPLFGKLAEGVKESSQLAKLRDTLLPKLLSGELSINPMQEANDD